MRDAKGNKMKAIRILSQWAFVVISIINIQAYAADFRINDVSITEGNSGTQNLNFTVSIDAYCRRNVTYRVDYTTSDVTATAGSDYTAQSGTISYSRTNNQSSGTCGTRSITIPIQGDTDFETDETFTITLSNPRSSSSTYRAYITDRYGTGTILNDDVDLSTNGRLFEMRFGTNIGGNLKVIGNTILVGDQSSSLTNADLDLRYADIDGNSATFNSSSATLEDSDIVDPSKAKIIWAGLYWQSYLHRWDNGFGGSANNPYRDTGWTVEEIENTINNQTILFTAPNGVTYTISPDQTDMIEASTANYPNRGYSCFANVTDLVKNQNPLGQYIVANIPAQEGDTRGYTYNDGLGNYGAWTLVVVYSNPSDPDGKNRNISIFDGYQKLEAASTANMSIPLSGFLTPKSGTIDSTLSVFAGEGDRNIAGDFMRFTNEAGTTYTFPSTTSGTNFFNSSIANVPTRNPNLANNNGIDIHTNQVGDSNGGPGIILNNQSSGTIRLGTTQDTYFPSMIAFATELYRPNFCYDYTVRKNDYTISSDNRDISTIGEGFLTINPSIRSMEGDFDLFASKLKLRLTPADRVRFTGAQYSPDTVNILIPAVHTLASTSQYPEIGIGSGVGEYPTNGGIIGSFERYFAEFKYDFLFNIFNGHFEIDLNASIDFGSGPVNFLFSSENNSLPRCEQSPVYWPQWGIFNIERTDSGSFDPILQADQRFTLYTQVAGRDFDFSVVAYDGGSSTPLYSQETSVAGLTVDVELIDASPYDDYGSFFKCNNTDPNIIQQLPDGETSQFVTFPSSGAQRVDLTENDDFRTNTALKNAAFRIWILVDQNNTIIPHTCTKDDNACFETIYTSYLEAGDAEGYCTNCSSYPGGCYACLRNYFAKAICSRDNFSVRPASYRISISDTNESNALNSPHVLLNTNHDTGITSVLAAEYLYKIDANATQFNSDNFAKQYNRNFYTPSNIDLVSQFKFQNTSGSNCADTSDHDIGVRFENGQIFGTFNGTSPSLDSNNLQSHSNVGNYRYHIEDNNWTIVDQQRYPHKTFKSMDDCIPNQAFIASASEKNIKMGCKIDSELTYETQIHKDLPLKFEPYRFDLSRIEMSLPNPNINTVYTNDLNTSNILDRAMAVHFTGELIAQGKQETQLSNFTNGCAAKPVIFDINRTMTRNNKPIDEQSILSIDLVTANPSRNIYLQRYDSETTTPALRYSLANSNIDSSTQITIAREQFQDDNNGSANVNLDFNLQRISDQVMNPINIAFIAKEANSTAASSNAHMISNYIPEGNATINQSVIFLYGRIAPSSANPYIVPPSQSQTIIPMYAEAYCEGLDQNMTEINCSLYGLNITSLRDDGVWWTNANHSSTQGDGQIESLTDAQGGTGLSIVPNGTPNPIDLTNPTNITVTIGNINRPYTTVILVVPTVPWLGYNPYGILNPIVDFLGGGGWTGKGNTGMIVDTNASYDDINYRIEW